MSAITVLNKDNVPMGPFTRAQIAEKLQSGEFYQDQLAFVEGLAQWTPLHAVLAKVDAEGVSGAPPFVPASSAATHSPAHVEYAGFWLRFAAIFIDGLIIGIPIMIVSAIIGFVFGYTYGASHPSEKLSLFNQDGGLNGTFILMELIVISLSMFVRWLYFALQECSSAQATLGKRVLGLKVTDLEGRRIGFGKATGRFFGKILSGIILWIGYMMAGFTERKQALHDMIAGTLVIRK
jgi:uncharacterized RDD family membrane protein YckC